MVTQRFNGVDYSKHYFEGWTTEMIVSEIEFSVCARFQRDEITDIATLKKAIATETPYKKKAFPEVVKHFKKLFNLKN